ncbi:uncharacterized protein LOC133199440 [Saccostrea echinata]|uniref:uncharacterized protein LOC133199440 n=1 Tax=Saccostrea echinata TaxID=191078 RepID=UPI002A7FB906|nr:uncharacterized protein LOC133199440 [Saccostrea echinata]
MDSSVLLVYDYDGSKIVDTVRKRLEQCDVTVRTAKISHVIDPPPCSASVLFLTPGMLSILKSSSRELKLLSKVCALFFHDTINITGKSVQEILVKKLPFFPNWRVYPIVKKVRKLTLQILELIDAENEEADPEFCLLSEFTLYPDTTWKQDQDVIISFNSERSVEDKVMVETDNRLFEVTWLNPYTSRFKFADNCDYGKRTVTVYVNEVPVGSTQVVIKDRNQCILDEISDVRSPLHYLREILNMIEGREEKLHSEMSESLILKGTKKLLKTLQKKSIVSNIIEPQHSQDEQDSKELDSTTIEEGDVIFRRRPTRQAFKKRSLSDKSHTDYDDISEEEQTAREEKLQRKNQRISLALENISMKEDFPSIDFNEDLLKSLPSDFFDSLPK